MDPHHKEDRQAGGEEVGEHEVVVEVEVHDQHLPRCTRLSLWQTTDGDRTAGSGHLYPLRSLSVSGTSLLSVCGWGFSVRKAERAKRLSLK